MISPVDAAAASMSHIHPLVPRMEALSRWPHPLTNIIIPKIYPPYPLPYNPTEDLVTSYSLYASWDRISSSHPTTTKLTKINSIAWRYKYPPLVQAMALHPLLSFLIFFFLIGSDSDDPNKIRITCLINKLIRLDQVTYLLNKMDSNFRTKLNKSGSDWEFSSFICIWSVPFILDPI